MPRLDEAIPIPSPPIMGCAVRVEAEARRLASVGRGVRDGDLLRLWHRLAMWSSTLAHMAHSGPASHADTVRSFDADIDDAQSDPMIQFTALSDLIAFVTVGDMVLSAIAAVYLNRWACDHADDNPWRDFMTVLDARGGPEDDPMIGPSRRADLDVRQARHRLVAHRRRYHSEMIGWTPSNAIFVDLVNVAVYRDDEDGRSGTRDRVARLLQSCQRRLIAVLDAQYAGTLMWEATAPDASETRRRFDWLHEHVVWMDSQARKDLAEAHQIAGFETVDPQHAVEAVLSLTSHVTGAVEASG